MYHNKLFLTHTTYSNQGSDDNKHFHYVQNIRFPQKFILFHDS